LLDRREPAEDLMTGLLDGRELDKPAGWEKAVDG
jgi:hypothetical protein